jgi:hypothetical protein
MRRRRRTRRRRQRRRRRRRRRSSSSSSRRRRILFDREEYKIMKKDKMKIKNKRCLAHTVQTACSYCPDSLLILSRQPYAVNAGPQ